MSMHEPVPRRSCKGVTLIEVLVTVLIFAVGLLGVAALQVVAKKTNYDAVQRTTAAMLAQDIVERMRANPKALDVYVGKTVGVNQTAQTAQACSPASLCNAAQMAQHDLWQWEQSLNGASEAVAGSNTGGLSQPTGCIEGPAGGGNGNYTVTIAWRGMRQLSNPTAHTCGADPSVYGTDNAYRRLLSLDVYIAQSGV